MESNAIRYARAIVYRICRWMLKSGRNRRWETIGNQLMIYHHHCHHFMLLSADRLVFTVKILIKDAAAVAQSESRQRKSDKKTPNYFFPFLSMYLKWMATLYLPIPQTARLKIINSSSMKFVSHIFHQKHRFFCLFFYLFSSLQNSLVNSHQCRFNINYLTSLDLNYLLNN